MLLQKWNYEKHKYEPYEVSDEWNCELYTEDMNELVNCPHCGKQLKYGDTYTSMEIHNHIGLGYGVCEKCYNNEWIRRRMHEQN